MSKVVFDRILGRNCAPTFKGIKAASLISLPVSSYDECRCWLDQYIPAMCRHGIKYMVLAAEPSHVLILIYNEERLRLILTHSAARRILDWYGYPRQGGLPELLTHLRKRCRESDEFPHEIGLFLDYPPADVRGFIIHKGGSFRYAGYWKIYVNEAATRAFFDRITACTEAFCNKLDNGIPMTDLLMAG